MEEYVRINFTEDREVFIDGELSGRTNVILRVGTGTHIFSLGEPVDYSPESVTRQIVNTSSIKPIDIDFDAA